MKYTCSECGKSCAIIYYVKEKKAWVGDCCNDTDADDEEESTG